MQLRRRVVVLTAAVSFIVLPGVAEAHGTTGSYEVKAGDSLSGIASKLDIRLSELLTLNQLTINSVILPGQRLTVPAHSSSPSMPNTATPSQSGVYTVKAGDSLSRIAAKLGVRLSDLLAVNGMTVSSLILPRQQLRTPSSSSPPNTPPATTPASGATYTVQAGDSLGRIATRHGVPLRDLLNVNGMTAKSLILPGRVLTLPAGATTQPPPVAEPQDPAFSSNSQGIQAVLDYARAQVGKPYKFFSAGPDTFDCSGLTKAAYAQIGITLVHQSASQARQGTAVDFVSQPIQPGDLIFLATRGDDTINHVGIALNATTWVHATRPGRPVTVGALPAASNIFAVRRLVG